MKIFKIFFTAFFICVILISVGVFVVIKAVDLNQLKIQITQRISQTVGMDVQLGNVKFDFLPNRGISLTVQELSLTRFKADPKDYFLKVKSSRVAIKVIPFLTKREILISDIELIKPELNLVQINQDRKKETAKALPGQEAKKNATDTSVSTTEDTTRAAHIKEEPHDNDPNLLIRSISITDGVIVYSEKTKEIPFDILIVDVDFHLSNFSFKQPFQYSLAASILSHQQNIKITGEAQVDYRHRQLRVDDLNIQTDLSLIALDDMNRFISQDLLKLEEGLKGRLGVIINQMLLDPSGLLVLSLDGQLNEGQLKFKGAEQSLDDIHFNFEMSESDFIIHELKAKTASGQVFAKGRVQEYNKEQSFDTHIDIIGLELSQIIPPAKFPLDVSGLLFGQINVAGKGFSPEQVTQSIDGEAVLTMKDGTLNNMNFFKFILNKISIIPNLGNRIEKSLSGKYREKLEKKSTDLGTVKLKIRLDQTIVSINELSLKSDEFEFSAVGQMDLKQNLELKPLFFIGKDLSEDISALVEELSVLRDEEGRVQIPLKPYQGPLKEISILPDIDELRTHALHKLGKEKVKDAILQAIDVQRGSDGDEDKPNPTEAIVDKILDAIPIFK